MDNADRYKLNVHLRLSGWQFLKGLPSLFPSPFVLIRFCLSSLRVVSFPPSSAALRLLNPSQKCKTTASTQHTHMHPRRGMMAGGLRAAGGARANIPLILISLFEHTTHTRFEWCRGNQSISCYRVKKKKRSFHFKHNSLTE